MIIQSQYIPVFNTTTFKYLAGSAKHGVTMWVKLFWDCGRVKSDILFANHLEVNIFVTNSRLKNHNRIQFAKARHHYQSSINSSVQIITWAVKESFYIHLGFFFPRLSIVSLTLNQVLFIDVLMFQLVEDQVVVFFLVIWLYHMITNIIATLFYWSLLLFWLLYVTSTSYFYCSYATDQIPFTDILLFIWYH